MKESGGSERGKNMEEEEEFKAQKRALGTGTNMISAVLALLVAGFIAFL